MRTVLKLWSGSSSGGAPWWSYWSAGITNTIGPAMGIEALKYISYPAQACFSDCFLSLTHLCIFNISYILLMQGNKLRRCNFTNDYLQVLKRNTGKQNNGLNGSL